MEKEPEPQEHEQMEETTEEVKVSDEEPEIVDEPEQDLAKDEPEEEEAVADEEEIEPGLMEPVPDDQDSETEKEKAAEVSVTEEDEQSQMFPGVRQWRDADRSRVQRNACSLTCARLLHIQDSESGQHDFWAACRLWLQPKRLRVLDALH